MNLIEHIMQREKLDIAKELAKIAKENAVLRDELGKLKAVERNLPLPPAGLTDWTTITKTIDERLAHKAEREHCESELHQLEDRRK
jgi:hypothetical protein